MYHTMPWTVIQHDDFEPEFDALPADVQAELFAAQEALSISGPTLGRPLVGTLNGSKHANMKELRFNAEDGVWRFLFAFDRKRQAVILVGGDKSGVSQDRFYKTLIKKADARFDDWTK
jgi:hypothetical protein